MSMLVLYQSLFHLIIILKAVHIREVQTFVTREIHSQFGLQHFDYLLVVDFEANIWDRESDSSKYGLEMIEFSCVLYDVRNDKILAEYQQYIKPYKNPILTNYCQKITGIQQIDIDNGVDISNCLSLFNEWLKEQESIFDTTLDETSDKVIVTAWTDWHIAKCLKYECLRRYMPFPPIFKRWIEMRFHFKKFYQKDAKPLYGALRMLDIKFNDTVCLHGVIDARNIVQLIREMIMSGVVLESTSVITLEIVQQIPEVATLVKRDVDPQFQEQRYDYLLVVDCEANLWNRPCPASKYGIEMIELGSILYDVKNDKIISEFQQYVKPFKNHLLNEYCEKVTGIRQVDVDNGVPVDECLIKYDKWLNKQATKLNVTFDVSQNNNIIAASWSDWHFTKCINSDCYRRCLPYPTIFNRWIDVRLLFNQFYKRETKALFSAFRVLDLTFTEGDTLHGVNDARYLVKLIRHLIISGVKLKQTAVM